MAAARSAGHPDTFEGSRHGPQALRLHSSDGTFGDEANPAINARSWPGDRETINPRKPPPGAPRPMGGSSSQDRHGTDLAVFAHMGAAIAPARTVRPHLHHPHFKVGWLSPNSAMAPLALAFVELFGENVRLEVRLHGLVGDLRPGCAGRRWTLPVKVEAQISAGSSDPA